MVREVPFFEWKQLWVRFEKKNLPLAEFGCGSTSGAACATLIVK